MAYIAHRVPLIRTSRSTREHRTW